MFFYHKAWYTDKLQQMKTLHKTRGLLFWHVEHFRGMPVLTSQKLQNQVRNEKPVRYSESSCLMGPACHWSCALSGRRHSRHTHAGRCRQWMGRWLRHRRGPPLLSPAQQCCLLRGGSGKEWCFVCLYLCCGYVHREIRQKKIKKQNETKKTTRLEAEIQSKRWRLWKSTQFSVLPPPTNSIARDWSRVNEMLLQNSFLINAKRQVIQGGGGRLQTNANQETLIKGGISQGRSRKI